MRGRSYQKKAYAAYYAKNREAVLAKNKAWRKANPDKNAEYRERWLAKPGSIETQRAACRNWRANNPDWQRQWDEANPEKRREIYRRHYLSGGREYDRAWVAANPDKVRAYQSKYRKNNLHKMTDKENRRRARMIGNGYEKVDRLAVYERDGGVCHICGKHVPVDVFTLDHLDPIAKGGAHVVTNLRVAHRVCNSRRGAGRLPAQLLLV